MQPATYKTSPGMTRSRSGVVTSIVVHGLLAGLLIAVSRPGPPAALPAPQPALVVELMAPVDEPSEAEEPPPVLPEIESVSREPLPVDAVLPDPLPELSDLDEPAEPGLQPTYDGRRAVALG